MLMGETAEKLADQYKIGRDEQDQFALESQRKAGSAIQEKRFESEIAPVKVAGRKGEVTVTADEHRAPTRHCKIWRSFLPCFAKGAPSTRATPRDHGRGGIARARGGIGGA